jgi:O-succinylbenzoic acid--CoA ligase
VLLLDNANEGLAAAVRGGAPVLVLRPGPAREERFWGLDEERLVLTTSGTSGSPQSVVLTTQQLVMSAFGSAVRLGHLPSDTWLLCLPLHHIGGLSVLFRCALYGTTVSLHERFDAGAVARALDSGETNLVSLVPRMLAKVLSAREASAFPLSVRCILLGGAPASELLLKRCSAIGAPVAQTWGMTETASQVCTSRPGQLGGLGEVGAPLTFSRVRSVNGRLEVTGPTAPGGSFLTPDVGEVSPSGGVKLLGRADDIIISGGENISPAEVERALSAHPSIADAAVVGLADERWGARPAAALVLEEGAPRPSLSELRSWCRERIDSFKAPDRCVWCEALPRRGELGKVSRQAVRDIFYEKNFEIDECVVCAQGTEEEAR